MQDQRDLNLIFESRVAIDMHDELLFNAVYRQFFCLWFDARVLAIVGRYGGEVRATSRLIEPSQLIRTER